MAELDCQSTYSAMKKPSILGEVLMLFPDTLLRMGE